MASYEIGKLVWSITGDTSGLDQSLKKSESTFSKFISVGKTFLGLGLAGAFIAIGKSAIEGAAKLEQQTIAFTTMLGSAEKAKSLMADLSKFAASTPFELPEIIDASKKLIAFGESADTVTETLRKIGDIASGVGVPVGELAEIYGKARTQGTLFSEDINQLAGRGIGVYQEFAKILGVSSGEVKKLASEGKISFGVLEQAFTNMTSQGGQFAGLMEAQSQSLAGQWSNLKDNLGRITTEIGTALLPGLKATVGFLNQMTETDTAEYQRKLGDLIIAQQKYNKYVEENGEERAKALGMDEEVFYLEKSLGIQGTINKSGKEREEIYKKLTTLSREEAQLAGIIAGSMNSYVAAQKKAVSDLVEEFNKTNPAMKKVAEQNQKTLSDADKKRIEERKRVIESADDFIFQNTFSETDKLNKEYQDRLKDLDKYKKSEIEYYKYASELETIYDDKKTLAFINNINSYANLAIGSFTNILSAFQNLMSVRSKAQIDALDAQMQAELEAAGVSEETTLEQAQREYDIAVASGDANIIEEKRRALEKAKIEEEYSKKRKKLEYEAALQSWEIQRILAVAQGAQAILNAYSSAAAIPLIGFTIAPYAAAAAALAAGIQIAAVQASKPQAPKYYNGGIIPGSAQGTPIIAGDGGRTEVVMNPDQMANTLMAIGNGGGGGGYRQVPPMTEEGLYKMIFNASQNGDLFIAERAVVNR